MSGGVAGVSEVAVVDDACECWLVVGKAWAETGVKRSAAEQLSLSRSGFDGIFVIVRAQFQRG